MMFDLAPAPMGTLYAKRPFSRDSKIFRIVAIDIKPETGLVFDEQSQQLTGHPLVLGEHQVMIHYQIQHGQEWGVINSCYASLVINPDPRSLWKNIPSDATQIYAKPDSASQIIKSPSLTVLAASQRGRSHAHKGAAREDDFFIATGEGWCIAIVSDGAGSAKYSRFGSQLICNTIGQFLVKALARPIPVYMQNMQLELRGALGLALCLIEDEAKTQQADVKDYASTVLVLVCVFDSQQQDYVYWTVAVGDGAIALYWPQTQQVKLLNMPDTGDYAGETHFLSDANFMSASISSYRTKAFVPCLLMTDGVSDAFFDSDNALKSATAWQHLWQDLQQNHALDDDKNLLAWLDFWSKGNHDDRTLVAIMEQ